MSSNTAFDILYRDYYRRVHGLCRRLLNSSELAEDAAQETFMKAYRNFRKFDPERTFWSWVAAIASNHCIDVLRQRSRSERLFGNESEEIEALEDGGPAILSSLIASEEASALHTAIEALPDKYRIPLVLAYLEQTSYDEIAERLEITRTHVGVLLLRAKQRLRKHMDPGASV